MSSGVRLTVAEYDQMVAVGAFDQISKKIELIHGEIQAMNPAGPMHDDLITLLCNWSVRATIDEETLVRVQCGISLPEVDSQPEPDIAWVAPNNYRERHPEAADVQLLIEVSDSSLDHDRAIKAELYASAGIVEYWVVNVREQVVHVYREPSSAGYRQMSTYADGQRVAPMIKPDAELGIDSLFR